MMKSRNVMFALLLLTSAAHADLPLAGAMQVTTGGLHSCALLTGAAVKCWGFNSDGQLGNGTRTYAAAAVDVVGLLPGVQSVSAGGTHTCVVTAGGGIRCWGNNIEGQLGDGTKVPALSPVDVSGLSGGVVAVAAGGLHTCALTSAGTVKCWGHNGFGQLGDNSFQPSDVPVDVSDLSGVIAISAGLVTSCALTNAGAMKCWGNNAMGELGDGSLVATSPSPVEVSGLAGGVVSIAAGSNHTCAITSAGAAKCWGANGSGQVGSGMLGGIHRTPVDVVGLSAGVARVVAGGHHTCALMQAGTAMCWGYNENGQLGTGTRDYSSTPSSVVGVSAAGAVSAGGDNSCALLTDGSVRCWGYGLSVGHGEPHIARSAVDVDGLSSGVADVGGGVGHTCALTSAGGVKCWGDNFNGQLGTATTNDSVTAVNVTGLSSGVTAIAVGGWHTCALTSAGGVNCWGSNNDGRLGNGTLDDAHVPTGVTGLGSGVAAIAAGLHHSCALTNGGAARCWGSNGSGQLGTGTTDGATVPQDVSGLASGVLEIVAGAAHTCARLVGGAVKCWGSNAYGQLGDGTFGPALTPVDVVGMSSGVVALAAGLGHSCAVTDSGSVKCWGSNVNGELGTGTRTGVNIPSDVASLTVGAIAIELGSSHTCARLVNGTASCWGGNWVGQTGNGGGADVLLPTATLGLGTGTLALGLGQYHSCAITSVGGVKCWGLGERGQLGNGGSLSIRLPVTVLAAGCSTFSDVAASNVFCSNVSWIHNRSVTLGCAGALYCPDANVTRVAMAAFLNRLGTTRSQRTLVMQQATGPLDPDAQLIVCQTTDWTATGHDRRVEVDAVLTFVAASDVGIHVELLRSLDSGTTWHPMTATSNPRHAKANRWANTRALGSVDITVGETIRFGIQVSRGGIAGAAQVAASGCHVRARIADRNNEQ